MLKSRFKLITEICNVIVSMESNKRKEFTAKKEEELVNKKKSVEDIIVLSVMMRLWITVIQVTHT